MGGKGECTYDESSPSGKNRWAEAVGAYTAWYYSDRSSNYKVGIIDNGFYFSHEDLKGYIFGSEDQFCGMDKHGTHVAGIIGATDNEIGIRGIADGADLVVADWDRTTNYLVSGEVLVLHKEILDLLNSNRTDFLFVKFAGNGYDNVGEEGIDPALTGYFCSMSEEVYNKYLSGMSYTYEQLIDHINCKCRKK